MGHGHVTPNPDGSKARCGGPALCPVCAREAGIMSTRERREDAVIAAARRLCVTLEPAHLGPTDGRPCPRCISEARRALRAAKMAAQGITTAQTPVRRGPDRPLRPVPTPPPPRAGRRAHDPTCPCLACKPAAKAGAK